MIPKQNKYYIDASIYANADGIALQAQATFPKVRFGVGPAALNANFAGDANAIVAFLSTLNVKGPPQPAEMTRFVPSSPSSAQEQPTPVEAIQYKEGDVVFVPSLGIEAKIKSVLPHGIVNVELADGITETMLARNLEPVQMDATNPSSMTAAPRPASDAAPPAAPSGAAPPPVPSNGSRDASTPPPNAAPPAEEAPSRDNDGDTASRGEP